MRVKLIALFIGFCFLVIIFLPIWVFVINPVTSSSISTPEIPITFSGTIPLYETQSFTVNKSEWRIDWALTKEFPLASMIITVYNLEGQIISVIAATEDFGHSYVHKQGDFYLEFCAFYIEHWQVTVHR